MERRASGGVSYLAAPAHSGTPLAILHGIGSAASSFLPLMHALGPAVPILAWDAPGYGASRALPMEWPQARDYAAVLHGLLDRLGHRKVTLLGHSLGALIAADFAILAPERVERLVLVSPALGYASATGAPLPAPVAARVEALALEGAQRFAQERGPRLVHRPGERADIVAAVVAAMAAVSSAGYLQASRMLACGDLVAAARNIRVPADIVVGAEDAVTPPANARKLHDALMAATPALGHRLTVVADAGHAVCQEKPGALAALLASAGA